MYVSKPFGMKNLLKTRHIPLLLLIESRWSGGGRTGRLALKKKISKDTQVLRDDLIIVIKGMAVFWRGTEWKLSVQAYRTLTWEVFALREKMIDDAEASALCDILLEMGALICLVLFQVGQTVQWAPYSPSTASSFSSYSYCVLLRSASKLWILPVDMFFLIFGTGPHYAVQPGLELTILPSQPIQCWDYKCVLPRLTYWLVWKPSC